MNLVLHQLRKDLRQFWKAVAVWWVLLAVDLAANLSLAGVVRYDPRFGYTFAGNEWSQWLVVLLWLLLFLLPAMVVLADSPAKTDSSLGTRPMPKRDLFAAKALFVLLVVVLPPVVQECLHLTLKGLSAGYVIHGTLERLLFVAPCAVLSAGFAGLWPNLRQLSVALAASLGGFWLMGGTVTMINQALTRQGGYLNNPTTTHLLAWLYFLAAALVGLAWLNERRRWQVRSRGFALGGVGLASLLILAFWPWNFFLPRPGEPATLAAAVDQARFDLPLRGFNISCLDGSAAGQKLILSARALPRLDPLPADCVAEWSSVETDLVLAAGTKTVLHRPRRPTTVFAWMAYPTVEEARAFAHLLGVGTLFSNPTGPILDRSQASLGTFWLARRSLSLEEPVSLRGILEARLFCWEKVAELSLAPGSTAKDAAGVWEVIAAPKERPGGDVQVVLRRDQVQFATSCDPQTARSDAWMGNQYRFLFHHAGQGVALFPESQPHPRASQGEHTAHVRLLLQFGLNQRQVLMSAPGVRQIAETKLVIFRKTYLGAIRRPWASPSFALGDFQSSSPPANIIKNEQLSTAEFQRRLAALPRPGPQASRVEVGRYLTDTLRLLDAARQHVSDDHPLVRQLAGLVPKHLAVFLEGLPATQGVTRSALMAALKLGVEESQKPEIIGALRRQPEMVEVVLARGWTEDAREALYQLLKRPGPLPWPAFQGIAWFEDPQTYSRLLDELEAQQSLQLYEVLRALPGIQAGLDRTVERIWSDRRLSLSHSPDLSPAATVAMRHGKVEALGEAYRLFNLLSPEALNGAWQLRESFRNNVVLRGLKPEDAYDHKRVWAWLAEHRPEDFRFDPARRRFVLRGK